jgi:predicted Zn-dependent protease with MMP-like domain
MALRLAVRAAATVAIAVLAYMITSPILRIVAGGDWSLAVRMALWTAYGLVALVIAVALERDARSHLAAAAARRAAGEERARRLASSGEPFPPSTTEFDGVVAAEFTALPDWIRAELDARRVHVHTAEMREGAPNVLGIYERRPIAAGTFGGATVDVDAAITLYRLPLMFHARTASRLGDAVRATLLHEVGHALGMNEDDLDRFSIGNRPRPDAIRVSRR